MREFLFVLPLLLMSCAKPAPPDANPETEMTPTPTPREAFSEITYSETACYGSCPVFTFSVNASGEGDYHGEGYVAVIGQRDFAASQEQIAAFVGRLEPFRPHGKVAHDLGNCDGQIRTDSPAIKVTWVSPVGVDELQWYLGCAQPGLVERADEIYGAWQELPVADLIGTSKNRVEYPRE